MKNGMDADIKSMTQAEKAMLRYQYVLANTTAAQGDFARTADTWANQVRILKQNFQQLGGIIGGALINAFKPFLRTLNFVMQKVISFATTVTNALGAIFGWKFEVSGGGVADDWSDAASSADDLADSTGKAADNTKKMKTNLLAIDELNVLNQDDSNSGSGGSGSGAGGAGGGAGSGGLVKTDTIWKDFESNIKDLYQLGEYIRDALIGFRGRRDFLTGDSVNDSGCHLIVIIKFHIVLIVHEAAFNQHCRCLGIFQHIQTGIYLYTTIPEA
jgi:hypothetical protein